MNARPQFANPHPIITKLSLYARSHRILSYWILRLLFLSRLRACRAILLPNIITQFLLKPSVRSTNQSSRVTCVSATYSKGQNARRVLRQDFDEVLGKYDALAMPVSIVKPRKLVAYSDLDTWYRNSAMPIHNTCAFAVTGHPAFVLPVARKNNLPLSVQLVGKYFDEGILFGLAHKYEENLRWEDTMI